MYHVDRVKIALHVYGFLLSTRKTSILLQVSHSSIARWVKQIHDDGPNILEHGDDDMKHILVPLRHGAAVSQGIAVVSHPGTRTEPRNPNLNPNPFFYIEPRHNIMHSIILYSGMGKPRAGGDTSLEKI
jgi:hypothetical protein